MSIVFIMEPRPRWIIACKDLHKLQILFSHPMMIRPKEKSFVYQLEVSYMKRSTDGMYLLAHMWKGYAHMEN